MALNPQKVLLMIQIWSNQWKTWKLPIKIAEAALKSLSQKEKFEKNALACDIKQFFSAIIYYYLLNIALINFYTPLDGNSMKFFIKGIKYRTIIY